MAINYIQLTGNMLQPEMRTTQTGKTIAKASMVVKTYGEDNDDMWVDDCGKLAENSMPHSQPTQSCVMVEGTQKRNMGRPKYRQSKSKYLSTQITLVCLDYQSISGVSYSGDEIIPALALRIISPTCSCSTGRKTYE